MKSAEDSIYRRLQEHLDRQPVGFPRVRSGADIRLLKRLFTPEEARLACHLSHTPATLPQLLERLPTPGAADAVEALLDAMFQKGVIAGKTRDGKRVWYLFPLVVGMFESQLGNLTRRFAVDAARYMQSLPYGRSLLAAKPSQMRTVPVNKSIPIDRPIATHDHIRGLIDTSEGPYVLLTCICRKLKAMQHKPCKQTSRVESCLAVGETATMCLERGIGREVMQSEALDMLAKSESEGLVVQPSNTQRAEFVCSCCGCCCGMLGLQKILPRPVDFWTSNFYAEVNETECVGCGKCVERCQVDALSLSSQNAAAQILRHRCIGCGLCVTTCPTQAVVLRQKKSLTIPPMDEEALYDQIKSNRKTALGELTMLLKLALRIRQ